MSRIRIIITIIVVVLTTLLTGCTGKEPNEIAYVVALGIDSTDDDNYKITIQYANTTQISGGASESGGKAGSEIVDNVTIEAPNIYAGVGLANNIVSKSFSMSHAKLIVFSKEIAEKGVKDMIETLVRSEEIRPDVFIAVANTTANDYLTSVNPEMEVNPAQYYQLIYQKNQLVGIPDGQLREFFTGLYTDNYDSIFPVAGVIEGSGGNSQNEGSEGSSESLDSFESKSSNEKDENEKLLNNMLLKQLLNELGEEEKQLIELRYFREMTQMQVAKILGISQVQVSRTEKKILLKMRQKL